VFGDRRCQRRRLGRIRDDVQGRCRSDHRQPGAGGAAVPVAGRLATRQGQATTAGPRRAPAALHGMAGEGVTRAPPGWRQPSVVSRKQASDLGVHDPQARHVLPGAPHENPDAVTAVYTDRIYPVREKVTKSGCGHASHAAELVLLKRGHSLPDHMPIGKRKRCRPGL